MIPISKNTLPIPGKAVTNPSTTRRNRGAAEMTRSTRKMRKARRTDSPWVAGISAIPTIKKSKTFHPERKNRAPWAISFSATSITKIARQIQSNVRITVPAAPITSGDVSRPKRMALKMITPMMNWRMRVRSSQSASICRVVAKSRVIAAILERVTAPYGVG